VWLLTVALNVAHPASMKIPPNGVIGPRKRNLGRRWVSVAIDGEHQQRNLPLFECGQPKDGTGEQNCAPDDSGSSKLVSGIPVVLGNRKQRDAIEGLRQPEGLQPAFCKLGRSPYHVVSGCRPVGNPFRSDSRPALQTVRSESRCGDTDGS